MKISKKTGLIFLVGLFLVGLPMLAWAASNSVYVAENEIIDGNFIKTGNIIDIKGAVNGDVIVAGNIVTIDGDVAGDVIAAGNDVVINGQVGGSVRVAGSNVSVNNLVSRNVWAIGSSVSIGKDASVGWDIYSAGASVSINAPVEGNVWVGAASVVINNKIGKNLIASIDKEGEVVLSSNAKVEGDLTYKAFDQDQLVLREGAEVIGQTTREDFAGADFDYNLSSVLDPALLFIKIVGTFGLLIVGLVLVSLIPKKVLEIDAAMMKKPWMNIVLGLLYVLVTPMLIVLLTVSIIGIPLAVIILPLYIIGMYMAKVFASFTIGLYILNSLNKDKYKGSLIWALVLGVVVFVLVTSIPFIGWLVKLILVLWALGAIMVIKEETIKEWS